MRFLKTVMLAAATAGVMATQASAQTSVGLATGSTAIYTTNNGGAWYANITGYSVPLNNVIIYCIDQSRQFNPGNSYSNYKLYTFGQFLTQVAGAPNTTSPWNGTLTGWDLSQTAYLTTQYLAGSGNAATNSPIQQQIWDISTNAINPVVAPPGSWSNYRVLYNGKNQTFMVQVPPGSRVPEPATFALMVAGLAGLGVVARRRQNNA